MRFGVLGPLAVWTTDGAEVAVPGAKVRALLAHLLVHPGHPVSADRLIDALWGEELPDHPSNALQGKVSQLRRTLERAERGGRALVGAGPAGYALRVAADAVDTGRFARLLERARAADVTGDRIRLLDEALGLWRGETFADFADDAFARGAIGRLEEDRLTAWEDRAEARLASGEHGPLAADLADLVVRHPLRERLRSAQMRALYRAGRQAEALAAYEELRRRLAEELGLVPGPELAALHGAILRQDSALDAPVGAGRGTPVAESAAPVPPLAAPAPPADTPPAHAPHSAMRPTAPHSATRPSTTPHSATHPSTTGPSATTTPAPAPPAPVSPAPAPGGAARPAAPRTNLPAPVAPLIGRDDAVPGVRQLLTATRLVTLTGPGGVGKTRLAVAAACGLVDRFPDGVWLVELAGLEPTGPGRAAEAGPVPVADSVAGPVAEAVARTLGLHEEPGAAATAVERLAEALRARRLLLVLDNCEHLVDAVAELAEGLLRDAPGLTVLATSQEPLDVSGERVLAVPPLELAGAMELFRQRAGLGPGADLGADDAEAVAELCVRLDGLPLALELAAARVRTMGVHGLLSRIDDRFALLGRGFRGAPARQRTLHAVIDWSWSLLSPPERTVLRRLAVHDGCTLDAARTVSAGGAVRGADVLDLLSRLVDRSLVVASDRQDGPRYCVLESVREYGAEQLREAGELADVRERHSAHYARLAVTAGRSLHGPEQRRWLDRLDEESANLRRALDTAVERGAVERALDMANALAWYWVLRGRITEARRSLDAVLAMTPGAGARGGEPGAVSGVGPGPRPTPDLESEPGRGAAQARESAPDVPHAPGPPAPAGSTAAARALALAWRTGISLREGGDDAGVDAYADVCAGTDTGVGPDAEPTASGPALLLQATLAAHRDLDDPSGRATALWILGSAQLGAGAVRTGERLVDEALDAFSALGDAWGTAAALSVRARHALARGDLAAVRRDSERSARLFRELGDEWGQLQTVFPLATLSEIAGDYAGAARLHREGLAIAERLKLWTEASKRLSGLGRIALLTGDFEEARAAHGRALRLARDHSFRSGELDARIGLGLGARREGDLAGAEEHMRDLLDWFRRADYGPGITLALAELGFVAELRGDAARAHALHAEGFDVAVSLGDARALALALEGLAGAAGAAGEHRAAATLLGAAAAARTSVGAPLPTGERRDVDRVAAAAEARLGGAAYATAFDEGGHMSPEQARRLVGRTPERPREPLPSH
ncbi:AfsR/SARP family transcriptional regulator [Streptomyces flavofungini]|uniref:AfsR/SARP family transcriptional regulator n=1 Tax=Streptomyces flavofungini TaxID=68200 RepID=UPI0025B16570|nr:BTAD domain-containing putative transcriptional regulator [Streptomyces flavofungini]WJV50339.1 BTAD domain-containing putative transcriptional regulator [Streptomyces flavofungini]